MEMEMEIKKELKDFVDKQMIKVGNKMSYSQLTRLIVLEIMELKDNYNLGENENCKGDCLNCDCKS